MTLPSDLDSATAMLGELVKDPRLAYGLATVAVVLIGAGLIAWIILAAWQRRP